MVNPDGSSPKELTISAILDSGSTMDLIRADLVYYLDLKIDKNKKVDFLAADGQVSSTLGQTTVDLYPDRSHDSMFKISPFVCQDLPADLLVGMHTLASSVMDFRKGMLTLLHENKRLYIPIKRQKTDLFAHLAPTVSSEGTSEIQDFIYAKDLERQNTFSGKHFYELKDDLRNTGSDIPVSNSQVDIISKIKIGKNLSDNQTSIVKNLLREFSDVFQVNSEISLFKNGDHPMMHIPLTSKRYSRDLKVPVIPTALYDQWSEQLRIWLENGIVEKQTNQVPYLGGFVPVKKKDGSFRFAYDARNVNAIIEDEHILLPRTDTLAANLAGRKFYCSLDLCSFYLNFLVHPDSRDLLSFHDPVTSTMYRFTRSIFGLKGSCQTSVSLMNDELAKIEGYNENIIGYVDDINLSSDTFEHMIDLLKELFVTLRRCSVKLKPSKCIFFESEINIFGFLISAKGMTISPGRSEALLKTPLPKSKKQLISHLASINYFRSLCPLKDCMAKYHSGFADLVKTTSKFDFTEKHKKLWKQMHQMVAQMISRQRLMPSDKKVILRVDSSEGYFGYCLSVKRENGEIIILTGSRIWSTSSRNWHITRKELVGCLEAIKTLEWALINRHVTIVTDNSYCFYALKFPHRISLFEPSLISRKLVALSLIDYSVEKATNDSDGFKLADSLSRGDKDYIITPRNTDQLLTEYKKSRDEYPTLLCKFLPQDYEFCNFSINTSMRDAKLFQDLVITVQNSDEYKTDREVPEVYRMPLILQCHNLGHLGFARVLHVLSRFGLSWPKKDVLIRQVLAQCSCAKFKPLNRPIVDRNSTVEATRPFQIIEIDCNQIGQFNPIHLLVCVCPFSKYIMAERVGNNLTAKTVLLKLFSIIARYCPQVELIRMDNASYFKSDSFQDALQTANINVSFGSRHNSRALSNVERANRKINEQLRFRELDSLSCSDFEIILQSVITSLNCAPSPDLPFSPFEIIYGLTHSPFDENFNRASISLPKDMIIKGINDVQQLRALFLSAPNEDLHLYDIGDMVRIRSNPRLNSNKILNLKFTDKLYVILDKNSNRGTYKLCAQEDQTKSNPPVIYSHHRFIKLFKKKNEPILPSLKEIKSLGKNLSKQTEPLDSDILQDNELTNKIISVPTTANEQNPPMLRRSTRNRRKPKRFQQD